LSSKSIIASQSLVLLPLNLTLLSFMMFLFPMLLIMLAMPSLSDSVLSFSIDI